MKKIINSSLKDLKKKKRYDRTTLPKILEGREAGKKLGLILKGGKKPKKSQTKPDFSL